MSALRKVAVLSICLSWFSCTLLATGLDSLYKQLEVARGTQQVEVYFSIIDLISDSEVGFELGNKVLALSKSLGYQAGIANSLLALNKFNLIEKKYSETIKNAFRALHLKDEFQLESVSERRICHQLTNALKQIGAFSDAIHFKKRQLQIKQTTPITDSLNLYYLNSQLAELYYKTEAYDSALVYYKSGLKVAAAIKSFRYEGSSYNNIALAYQQLGLLDSARFYFEKARYIYAEKAPKTSENYNMLGIIEGNIGTILPNSNPNKAKFLLRDIYYNFLYEKGIHLVRAYLEFAHYKMETGQYEVAKNYLDSANALLVEKQLANPAVLLRMYQLNIMFAINVHRSDLASQFLSKYNHLYDSLYGENAVRELIDSRSTYELIKIENELTIERIEREKKEAEVLVLENEKVITKLKYTLILGVSALIIVIILLIILKNRSDLKRLAKETALEKKLLQQELDYGSKLLMQSSLGLKRKREFAEELTARIGKLDIANSSEKQALKLFVANELDIDGSMIEMEKFISEIGSSFFVRLKQQHPNLTENDIKLVVLIRMRLTNKQIAVVRGITPESVRIAKNRLCKKLNLASGKLLFEYLSSV